MSPFRYRLLALLALPLLAVLGLASVASADDRIRQFQTSAIEKKTAEFGHWGVDPANYVQWGTHSNRLVPVYTFGTAGQGTGVDLTSYTGTNSPYRSAAQLQRIYGRLPSESLHPEADYLDQTNLYDLQRAAAKAGKKHIFLVVFDGMDWQTSYAAALYKTGRVAYTEGRGTGLHFQDYTAGGTTQFAAMCTSPHNEGTKVDVNRQAVLNPDGEIFGGFNRQAGGATAWDPHADLSYLISKSDQPGLKHAYTDSSSSAVSMTAGIKTYNNGVNVDARGQPVQTIALQLQAAGWSVGAVSSVPISHATPAAAYAVNVHRDDYQDLTRDMLGLKSISHPETPLPGMDVVLGGGFGHEVPQSKGQGDNFVPGNLYLANVDLLASDIQRGGKYVTVTREDGVDGKTALAAAARRAREEKHRLLGFYGVGAYNGHLPFQTADGDFQPAPGRSGKAETYAPADLRENPTLADMTAAAIEVLSTNRKGFWLMVEPGDVDWANHDNNIDNSIGAVLSGDAAVKVITDWVDQHSNWNESLLIVTADHGHLLVLRNPAALIARESP